MFFEKTPLFTKDEDCSLIILRIGDKKIYKKIKKGGTSVLGYWLFGPKKVG